MGIAQAAFLKDGQAEVAAGQVGVLEVQADQPRFSPRQAAQVGADEPGMFERRSSRIRRIRAVPRRVRAVPRSRRGRQWCPRSWWWQYALIFPVSDGPLLGRARHGGAMPQYYPPWRSVSRYVQMIFPSTLASPNEPGEWVLIQAHISPSMNAQNPSAARRGAARRQRVWSRRIRPTRRLASACARQIAQPPMDRAE